MKADRRMFKKKSAHKTLVEPAPTAAAMLCDLTEAELTFLVNRADRELSQAAQIGSRDEAEFWSTLLNILCLEKTRRRLEVLELEKLYFGS